MFIYFIICLFIDLFPIYVHMKVIQNILLQLLEPDMQYIAAACIVDDFSNRLLLFVC
jgi:hypothetical protein